MGGGGFIDVIVVGGVVAEFSPHMGIIFIFERSRWPLLAGEPLFYFCFSRCYLCRYRPRRCYCYCYCPRYPVLTVAPRCHPRLLPRRSCHWSAGWFWVDDNDDDGVGVDLFWGSLAAVAVVVAAVALPPPSATATEACLP